MISNAPHTAVLIGRFQPFHNGHLALLQQALAHAQHVVVVLGSAFQARSPKNPFTWQERAHLISSCLSASDAKRVRYEPVRDYYDEARWIEAVSAAVQRHVPTNARTALIAHFKDISSNYLARFPNWELLHLPRQGDFDATPIRHIYWNLNAQPLPLVWHQLTPLVPPTIAKWLQDWQSTPAYTAMQTEWRMLAGYHAAWSSAPYPPVFVTVDSLVVCQHHVLLIQRGHAPGKGLWALPGGFVESHDTLWQSCLRELGEETTLSLPPEVMLSALQGVEVFDHPDRSLRGRTITHVFHFLLPNCALPEVKGGDDAARAHWVALDQIACMEEQMFEDHFHILRRCFARFGNGPIPALA